MQFQKLSLSRFLGESGSAVVEFVMVVLPCSLLILVMQGVFGLAASAQGWQQQAYELARFASLADVTSEEVGVFARSFLPEGRLTRVEDRDSCFVEANLVRSVNLWGWPLPIEFLVNGRVSCELQKT